MDLDKQLKEVEYELKKLELEENEQCQVESFKKNKEFCGNFSRLFGGPYSKFVSDRTMSIHY